MAKIEWTENDDGSAGKTWNPLTGCDRISPGCGGPHATAGDGGGCYAERQAWRLEHGFKQASYLGTTKMTPDGPRWTGKINLVPTKLAEPLHWRAPTRVFVNSMSDLFHKDVPPEFIAAVFGVMAATPRHTYQVLTKRANRMRQWCEAFERRTYFDAITAQDPLGWHRRMALHRAAGTAGVEELRCTDTTEMDWPLANVHLGVSVEDRRYGLPRIDHLRTVPAALRWLSIEPLLEDLGTIDLTGIGWVVVGAESGPGARPMQDDWVRSIRDQCVAAHVPFFFKQRAKNGRKVSLPTLDGRQWMQFPGGAQGTGKPRVSLSVVGELPEARDVA